MSKNQSTSTEQTQQTAPGAPSKSPSPRRGTPIARLQRTAGNQAVNGLIPVQRTISTKLDAITKESREEDDFLNSLGNALEDSDNPVVEKLLEFKALGGGKTAGETKKKDGSGSSAVSSERSLAKKKKQLKALMDENKDPSKPSEDTALDKQIAEQQAIKDRRDKGEKLAQLKKDQDLRERAAKGLLTPEEKKEWDQKQNDAATDREIKELEDKAKLQGQEDESKRAWGAMKTDDPRFSQGPQALTGAQGAQQSISQAATNVVDKVNVGNVGGWFGFGRKRKTTTS